jgi:hypothetical protein
MFSTHKLNDQGFAQVKIFKNVMASAVEAVLAGMPEGRERSIFLTKLDEAVFFGTKAIAGKPGNFTEVTEYPQY